MGVPVTAAAAPQPPAAPTASAASVGAAAAMAQPPPLDTSAALPPGGAATATTPSVAMPLLRPLAPSTLVPPSTTAGELPPLDPAALARALAHTQHPLRASIFSLFRDHPAFRLVSGASTAAARAHTAARINAVAAAGLMAGTLTAAGSVGRARLDAVSECLAAVDYSAAIGLGVHAGLFASAVAGLGSAAQAAAWAPRIEGMAPRWRGCFALTELGHGSDARGVETTAVWVPHVPGGKREGGNGGGYILDTPGEAAQKYWIGGAAAVARWAVVFAQLYTPSGGEGDVAGSTPPMLTPTGRGVHQGIHAFLVRIRTDRGGPVPTVTTADCGAKGGLNGVDNGRLWFDATPLPADALLCRHATVSSTGVYTCDLPGEDAVFATAMAALTGGRAGIAASAAAGARVAAAIAVRYGLRRRAFVPPAGGGTSAAGALVDGGDKAVAPVAPPAAVRLVDWPGWRLRVVPVVAWTVVYGLATAAVKEMGYAAADGAAGQGGAAAWGGLHVLTSAVKAGVTGGVVAGFQTVREALGGQGFKAENRVVGMRADWDVALTFEGDNYVLYQQVAKACVAAYSRGIRSGKFPPPLTHLNTTSPPLPLAPPPPATAASVPWALTALAAAQRVLLGRLVADMAATATAERRRAPPRTPAEARAAATAAAWAAAAAHQDAAADVASLHIRHTLLSLAAAHTAAAPSVAADLRPALAVLSGIAAAAAVDADTAVVRAGVLDGEGAAAVRAGLRAVTDAVGDAAGGEWLGAVADGMGVPDWLLAPVAFDMVAHNSRARL
ncbi:hypothetical protein MMPV_007688 [Pyropia vietnamensis]